MMLLEIASALNSNFLAGTSSLALSLKDFCFCLSKASCFFCSCFSSLFCLSSSNLLFFAK
ncbi:hypothetical protein MSU_0158 [Mycoplasma suis str. Illinois]|uniref:Uncharacterized protein n=1 Tax=Mycoplasma suis (strain Illinois) TaxID=768700 RepID=F0QQD2_MYCSL|nr:hypothetical protein MSU_0158 [Mycoplasma suis str. Illinois]